MPVQPKQLLLIPEFHKFITASASGRRLMPNGKRIRKGTVEQYRHVYKLLIGFEKKMNEAFRIQLLFKNGLRLVQKEKNYWHRFFKNFSQYMYKEKRYFDQYTGSVFKVLKVFFNYLAIEKALPVGDFHKRFRVPPENFMPVALSPFQLQYLITNTAFEKGLSRSLKKTKDIFVFGCTVALRYQDLMQLKKSNLQQTPDGGCSIVLHTQKTGAEVKIPLPEYANDIIQRYSRKAGMYILPRLTNGNLNIQIKVLIKKAGWNYYLPKIRHRQGEAVELKNRKGETLRFYDHISAHTMRRTAITTLLLMGVDETTVRKISGHTAGSKEFYRYVAIVQQYFDAKVMAAHNRLLETDFTQTQNLL